MRTDDARAGMRERTRTFTAGHDGGNHMSRGVRQAGGTPPVSRSRRFMRRAARRVAILAALLILFYATSLHGISVRTFVLATLLVLSLYWIFKGWL